MRGSLVSCLSLSVWLPGTSLLAQTAVKAASAPSKIEPGLELAVNWKWRVAPPAKNEWGMPLPEALQPKPPGSPELKPVPPAPVRPETYAVKKGDAIIKIARKFGMTAAQLKQFNNLQDDLIHIGEVLRIPTPGQLLTLVPPPAPPAEPKKEAAGKKPPDQSAAAPPPDPAPNGEPQRELENVRLQVFLDREMFSPGVIDGKSGATYLKISQIYQNSHADAASPGLLKAKAEAALKQPYTRYILRAEDFKFIQPAKNELEATHNGKSSAAGKKHSKADLATPTPAPPPVTIDGLVAADFLGYANAWEFVAERFHCGEAFLHHINPSLKGTPGVGTEFQAPNVIPFEIEKALVLPLQPVADPKKPVTAAVVLVSRLEISREGKLIAVMPLATARPGLHGRGSWTVLNAIPQPRLATKREPREIPKATPAAPIPSPATPGAMPAMTGLATPGAEPAAPAAPAAPIPSATPVAAATDIPSAPPAIAPPLENEQYLAPGPNNPVGIIWINLAKAGSTEPLPFGLHGTGIPAQMGTLQGIGGLRLTNWDIARAMRLMPAGT
ncbi:MAG: LysM peptidoglycan-binding domain-containing protein, partial [Verrucomicrobiota bacterium]